MAAVHIIANILRFCFAALGLAGAVWLAIRSLKRSEDPARLVLKWVLTLGVLYLLFHFVGKFFDNGASYEAAFLGIPLAAACGLGLFIIWRHSLAGIVAKPFEAMYTGGDEQPEPKPFYSIARAKQKQGKYLEAVTQVQAQLARFPTDVEGQMFLAQIQAEDLRDLESAELTIERFCEQPGHAPANIAFALYSLADWHLKVRRNAEGARAALEKLIALLPDSEFSLGAAQRIAHLGNPEMLLSPYDRKKFAVREGERSIGLLKDRSHLRPAESDPERQAADYVKHLEEHPLDTEARENLAVIYADHYKRLDMATEQLEEMIAQPNQPGRLVVRWLNLLADLQIRSGADYDTVKATLLRIIDRDPELAAAELARKRLALLKLELKAKEVNANVKLGHYERNIGLKKRSGLPDWRP